MDDLTSFFFISSTRSVALALTTADAASRTSARPSHAVRPGTVQLRVTVCLPGEVSGGTVKRRLLSRTLSPSSFAL